MEKKNILKPSVLVMKKVGKSLVKRRIERKEIEVEVLLNIGKGVEVVGVEEVGVAGGGSF